nr:CFF_HP1_G0009860.mRNA.1.CDS.1 [Saccharomyces cerevisiae]
MEKRYCLASMRKRSSKLTTRTLLVDRNGKYLAYCLNLKRIQNRCPGEKYMYQTLAIDELSAWLHRGLLVRGALNL